MMASIFRAGQGPRKAPAPQPEAGHLYPPSCLPRPAFHPHPRPASAQAVLVSEPIPSHGGWEERGLLASMGLQVQPHVP